MQNTIDTVASLVRFDRVRAEDPLELRSLLAICTREEYLAWIKEWKASWHELVRQIREEKGELRKPHVYPASAYLMSQRVRSRARAHAMLLLRAAARELARESSRARAA